MTHAHKRLSLYKETLAATRGSPAAVCESVTTSKLVFFPLPTSRKRVVAVVDIVIGDAMHSRTVDNL